MERRVSPCGEGLLGILPAKRMFPEDRVGSNDGRRKAGNTRLRTQRFQVIAEPVQEHVFRVHRPADQHHKSNRQG